MEDCKICKKQFRNKKHLSVHLVGTHKTNLKAYLLGFEYGGINPTCKCGCGAPVNFFNGNFTNYVEHHFFKGRPKSEKTRKKISEVQKGRKLPDEHKKNISNGMTKAHQENPNHAQKISIANKGKVRSPETRRKISETRKERIANGLIIINGDKISETVSKLYLDGGIEWSTGSYTSTKTGKTINYRSSYELKFAQILDEHPDVLSWEFEPFVIRYLNERDETRCYISDFQLIDKSNKNYIVEVKPLSVSLRNTDDNTRKREACINFCKEKNWTYFQWSLEEGETLILS